MEHLIRPIRPEEWSKVRELRLQALSDPVAPIAFLETLERAGGHPDSFWQQRAIRFSQGPGARQFVAEAPDGRWEASVAVLVEEAGSKDFLDHTVPVDQGHLVGVYTRPEVRGTGVTAALYARALDWAWALRAPLLQRVRLYVHTDNTPARASYRRFGFVPSGECAAGPGDPGAIEVEYVIERPEALR
ncbi:GNAT family N-acetyltransferase [Streptomyces sp. NPDC006879]|uniref:GNAT family N-acetyltransferase n=1 Tax=Streptomyces sp. NPDC006879 TaxID=3364767 RepID=UPI003686F0C6